MSETTTINTPVSIESKDPDDIIKFDRRHGDRHPVSGKVTVLRRNHDPHVYKHPICSLELQNMCDGGLAAHCDIALGSDESVAVYFPPHGPDHGLDMWGHVVRCQPAEIGYKIAIQFDINHAA